MSLPKTIFQGKDSSLIEVLYTRAEIDFPSPRKSSASTPSSRKKDGSPLANSSKTNAT